MDLQDVYRFIFADLKRDASEEMRGEGQRAYLQKEEI